MKPILFNAEMVRAILGGRKTVARRVVKPQPTEHLTCGPNWKELLTAAAAPAPPADSVPVPAPVKRMAAVELADILRELADQYPGAEISFDERPVKGVYLDVSFGSDRPVPVAVITMR